jgi:hypothetical protein
MDDNEQKPKRCPRCGSPDPRKHPAMQYEGEVQLCRHPWHMPSFTDPLCDGAEHA